MTVQELINELEKIEDKARRVLIDFPGHDESAWATSVEEYEDIVLVVGD